MALALRTGCPPWGDAAKLAGIHRVVAAAERSWNAELVSSSRVCYASADECWTHEVAVPAVQAI